MLTGVRFVVAFHPFSLIIACAHLHRKPCRGGAKDDAVLVSNYLDLVSPDLVRSERDDLCRPISAGVRSHPAGHRTVRSPDGDDRPSPLNRAATGHHGGGNRDRLVPLVVRTVCRYGDRLRLVGDHIGG